VYPGSTYEVFFGPSGALASLGETAVPKWTVTDLLPATTYSWKVVARDECGETAGPVWTFTTEPAAGPPDFRRGDAVADGQVNIADAIGILDALFLSGGSLGCLEAADIDDSGSLDLTDPVLLLEHLFLGGAAPAAPFPGCGADPTADGLGCGSYGACGG
jgi:hypothetical protein